MDPARRVAGLAGLRGLAALFVVVFHIRMLTFPKFPRDLGPPWLTWAMHGRLAVVFFLVLSGFSLALAARARGWRVGPLSEYARRRAWRILPPYWAALVLSLAVARWVVPASQDGPPGRRSALVHLLLLQDVTAVRTPNGAFWSIAVEAELYLAFPLLVLLRRRLGAVALLALVTAPVVAFGLAAPGHSPVEGPTWLAPNLAPVFALGLVTAGVVGASERVRRLPWGWLTLLAAAPVVTVVAARGPEWTVRHSFWVDLAAAPAMALGIAAVATARTGPVRWLDGPVLRRLGACSYSLYLIHLPIVMIVSRKLALPLYGRTVEAFWVTLAVALPLSVLVAYWFAKAVEFPAHRRARTRDAGALSSAGGPFGVAAQVELRRQQVRHPAQERHEQVRPVEGVVAVHAEQ